jgi:glycosyltransferase involved in cell wall biosynthesis
MAFLYSGIYTENSYMKNYIESLNRDQRIIVESPGIKKENIIPLDRVKNLKRDIDLLYLTSMTKNKGIFDFLAVVKEMQKEQNDIRIAIAGYASPEVLDYISTFATSNNIPHIELYSNIPENEKYKLYSRSKIYVLPSIEDGIPITFYEAWSYGVIVIGYNLETYTDIKNYFIPVEKGNAKELTDKCRNIYKNYSDNFNSLMEKAYRYSMNHSYEAGINNIIQGILKINEMINRDR